MMISFNAIPLDIRTPGQYVEIDASQARRGLPVRNPRVLLLGQMLAAGEADPLALLRVTSKQGAITAFGAASMLAQTAAVFLALNSSAEVWALPQVDDGAGVKATKTVTLTGPATGAGTLALMIAGRRVNVAVADEDTATEVATAAAAAVTAATDLPVTAGSAAGVLTLTARNAGVAGNGIDVRVNYYSDEATPPGLAVVIADGVAGATDPDIADAIAVLGDEAFDIIVMPWTSAANLTALETELADRWGPERMLDGLAITASRGSQGTLATFGDSRNSPYVSCIGANGAPNPVWEWAAALAAVVAQYGYIDPARPFQTLSLAGLLPPAEAARFTRAERELLLRDGVTTFTVDAGGVVTLERVISMYQEDSAGNADTAFLDLNTLLTLSYMRWSLRLRFAQKYPRHKLASDGVPVAAGAAVVTPKVARAELIAWARDLEAAGLLENVAGFKDALVVERDASDPNRLNALIPPDLVNQFIVFAAKIQFRL
ncbi:MAG: phage tail protein [Caulobacter sp.]|nr:phage tail protein [Caulobacter sp.]